MGVKKLNYAHILKLIYLAVYAILKELDLIFKKSKIK